MVRWAPFRELDLMERNMRRALEGFGLGAPVLPAADVYETGSEFVVELEVPGYEEKELEIEISDHMLTVKGERTEIKDETERTFRLHERLEKEFVRRFELPPEADTAKVKAVFKAGVLELHTPKAKQLVPKKIPIGK